MTYALIGTGKTGQAIQAAIEPDLLGAVFNARTPVTLGALQQVHTGIVFIPATAFASLMPMFLQSGVPLVIGTTGFEWTDDLDAKLKIHKIAWIVGSNFSIGLNAMHFFALRLQRALAHFYPGQLGLSIHEKHHIHKIDAPSGTALFLASSLGLPADEITAEREGDAKGTHTVSLACPHDTISMTHEAHDRAAFAEGVLRACKAITALPPGLHHFEDLAAQWFQPFMQE